MGTGELAEPRSSNPEPSTPNPGPCPSIIGRMTTSAKRTLPILVLVFVSAYAWVGAQAPAKKALGVEDYTRWRSISGQEISGDGAWVTYGVALTNTAPNETKPVLHRLNLATNQDV